MRAACANRHCSSSSSSSRQAGRNIDSRSSNTSGAEPLHWQSPALLYCQICSFVLQLTRAATLHMLRLTLLLSLLLHMPLLLPPPR
jgi:hypothetical protein